MVSTKLLGSIKRTPESCYSVKSSKNKCEELRLYVRLNNTSVSSPKIKSGHLWADLGELHNPRVARS